MSESGLGARPVPRSDLVPLPEFEFRNSKFEESSPLVSRDGDIDPPRQSNSNPGGGPPLTDPEAPPPGSSRQPFEDLLNWAAELDAALSSNQPLDVSRAPTGVAPLHDLDAFAPSSLEEDPPVDIEGLPRFTPLEEAEPAIAWPERNTDPAPPAAETPVAAQGTELERLVQELENDWFVADPEPAEVVGGNGQANTAIIVDEPSGDVTTAVPEADAPPEGFWQEQAPPRRRFSGRTAGIVALIATVAVAGVVFLVLALRGDGGGTSTATPSAVSFDLGTITIGSTAQVDTEWELSGKDGTQFASTLTFSNRSSAPAQVRFQEVIPKSLASSVDEVTFVGPQPTVVNADPVVQYVIDIPANGEVTRTFEIDVAPDGATRVRLAQWAEDLDNTSAKRQGTLTSTTASTTTAPETTLPPGPTEPTPTTGRRATTTTRGGGGPTTPPTEPPPTEPPPTEPPPTEPPPTEPPTTTVPPTTLPPPTTVPPTTAPPTTAVV